MAFIKDKSREKATAVIKALDKAVAISGGLAELLGCIVVLAIGSALGTELAFPVKSDSEKETDNNKIEG